MRGCLTPSSSTCGGRCQGSTPRWASTSRRPFRSAPSISRYCMRDAPDLATCYRKLTRWQRLLHDGANYLLETEGEAGWRR